jgi:hypothetical protein
MFFSRWLMMLFALLELIFGILLIVEITTARNHLVGKVATSANPFTNVLTDKTEDLKDALLNAVDWSLAAAYIAVISLITVSLYYSVGKRLEWFNSQNAEDTHVDSILNEIVKLIVIVIGAVGIVFAVVSACVMAASSNALQTLVFTSTDSKKPTIQSFYTSSDYAIGVVILKLLEAVLGHAWAIGLSNAHRDSINKYRPAHY